METITHDLRIDVEAWLESAATVPEEKHSLASVSIIADETPVCELEDIFARTVRPGMRVSAHALALWLVANWWRLRWEPERTGRPTTDWRLSHQIGAAGGGYSWPSLTLSSDGDFVFLRNQPTDSTGISTVRYIRSIFVNVTADAFERAVDSFVEVVLSRLSGTGCGGSDLSVLVAELREERSDPERSSWRRLEAMLGFDPDAAPEDLISKLDDQKARAGEAAVEEVAAASGTTALHDLQSITQALNDTADTLRRDAIERIEWNARSAGTQLPWQAALGAAARARAAWGIGPGPIRNAKLSEVLGIREAAISAGPVCSLPLSAGYRNGASDLPVSVALRSPIPENRRFELMRIVGDCLFATSDDHLLPVTKARTFRQKFQRAFAQEMLCPWSDLDAFVGPDEPDDDTIGDAARHFNVSQRLIETTLVNKGRLSRDALPA